MIEVIPLSLAVLALLMIVSLLFLVNPITLLNTLLDPEVIYALLLSLCTAALATIFSILLAFPSSYVLSKDKLLEEWLEPVLTLPSSLPPVAVGAILLLFFSQNPMGSLINDIVRIVFNIPGLIVAQTTVAFPYIYRVLKSSFKMIDEDLEVMVRSYGCSGICLFKELLLPLSAPGLKEASLLGFSRALGEFGASVTLAGAIRFRTETLPIAIYLNLSSGDVAKVVSLIIFSVVISMLLLRLGVRSGAQS